MGSSEAVCKDLMPLVTHGQTLCAMSQYLYFWKDARQKVRFVCLCASMVSVCFQQMMTSLHHG